MKFIKYLKERFAGLINSIERYPVTAAFLIAMAIVLAMSIHTEKDYSKLMLTFAVGAILNAEIQVEFERFLSKLSARFIAMACGVLLTGLYYLIIRSSPEVTAEIGIKTAVVLSAIFIAFVLVPAVKSKIKFEDTFMAVFKAFFQTIFYAGIIMGGFSLIIAAVNTLIYPISYKAYSYIADIIFVLFSPMFFLSLIPIYPGKYKPEIDENDENVKKAVRCPKFVDILFSYIIIPLISIYTLILLSYIALNVGKDFWSNNLLEPMLITYAIAVITTFIITSRLENKFVSVFRLIFPKALIVIVLFQIAASVVNISNTGITHGKYYVILFGIFAAVSGVLMCFKERKNGIVAAVFIIFCVISLIPPIDAFNVSRINQTNRLEAALVKNGMLEDNKIKPNSLISDQDKKIIIQSTEYLSINKYSSKITWLGKDFEIYRDFYNTFGFNQYDTPQTTDSYVSVYFNTNNPIDIKGYDVLAEAYINSDENTDSKICTINFSNKSYDLQKEKLGSQFDLVLYDNNKNEIIRFNTDELYSRYENYGQPKEGISEKDATFIIENNKVKVKLLMRNVNINKASNSKSSNASFYVLIKFK